MKGSVEVAISQLGNFEGRGLIHKMHTKEFLMKMQFGIIFCQISKKIKYYKNLPDFVTTKFNNDYTQTLYAEKGSLGEKGWGIDPQGPLRSSAPGF